MAFTQEQLIEEVNKHFFLTKQIESIMATQQEAAQELQAAVAQLAKSRQEVLDKIAALQTAADNSGSITPELQAAIDDVKAAAQTQDDIVPDAAVVDDGTGADAGSDAGTSTDAGADTGDGTAVAGV